MRAAAPVLDGAAFLLGFNRRFDPHVLALKQKLESGALGALGYTFLSWMLTGWIGA